MNNVTDWVQTIQTNPTPHSNASRTTPQFCQSTIPRHNAQHQMILVTWTFECATLEAWSIARALNIQLVELCFIVVNALALFLKIFWEWLIRRFPNKCVCRCMERWEIIFPPSKKLYKGKDLLCRNVKIKQLMTATKGMTAEARWG